MPKPIILIIEDDSLLITMYQTKFALEGYEVLTATDGVEAWNLLQFKKPDFVIMDVMMPKLSGMDLMAKLAQDPDLKKIPVIMFSNLSNPVEAEKAQQLGVKEFLVKANFTPKEIVEKVKSYLAR